MLLVYIIHSIFCPLIYYYYYYYHSTQKTLAMNAGVEMTETDTSMLFSSIFDVEMESKVKGRRRKKAMREEGEEAKKRRLSEDQVEFLEKSFMADRKLDTGRKIKLAEEAGLDPKQVAVWFQNRRTRWKCKKMEEDYNKFRSLHDTDIVQIHLLEAEVRTDSYIINHCNFFS